MPDVALAARRVLTPAGWLPGGVSVAEGRLTGVGRDQAEATGASLLDARHLDLVPGFIDIHIHGWGGHRCDGARAVVEVARSVARFGTTSFLPTLTGQPSLKMLTAAVEDVASVVGRDTGGAEVLGLHLEGPYLNPDPRVRGAQQPAFMRAPSVTELAALDDAAGRRIRYMTVAPELPGAEALIRSARDLGIVVGAGHTAATYAQILAAKDWGVRSGVHTFNGMTGIHHREPGAAGAILLDRDLVAEVIADGVHVALPVVELILRCKGPERVALITDATQLGGLPDGEYARDDGRKVTKTGKRAFLEGNHLAGSVVSLDENVRAVSKLMGMDLAAAVRMASEVPARLVGVFDRKGSLEPGKDADVVGLDEEGEVRLVMVGGELVYGAPAFPPVTA